ncbi:response regulator [Kiloniella antarctica]|uniref:Response regulator n=1 Tax=Kiloniella antarctica TaxID=1550907 RepID=A0ABW5BIX1_9PROT
MPRNKEDIHIHMAEDDEDDRLIFQEAMAEARVGNKITFSLDGQDLIDLLRRQGTFSGNTDPLPDIILLDLNMPRMDGREALQIIKADPLLKRIPVLILTTSKAEADIYTTYNEGANSFITKPVSFQGLVEAINTITDYWVNIVKLPD